MSQGLSQRQILYIFHIFSNLFLYSYLNENHSFMFFLFPKDISCHHSSQAWISRSYHLLYINDSGRCKDTFLVLCSHVLGVMLLSYPKIKSQLCVCVCFLSVDYTTKCHLFYWYLLIGIPSGYSVNLQTGQFWTLLKELLAKAMDRIVSYPKLLMQQHQGAITTLRPEDKRRKLLLKPRIFKDQELWDSG